MSFLRNLFADLVEKRLWPVALALVAALVAVPFVLGATSKSSPPQSAAAPAAGAPSSTAHDAALVSVEDTSSQTKPVDRAGHVRNPFRQLHLPKAPKQPASTPSSAPSTPSGPSSSGGSGGAVSLPTTPPATNPIVPPTSTQPTGPVEKPDARDVYRVSLRFGTPGNVTLKKDIARLTPLPSLTSPFFVFLGVKDDGKTAVFLVDSDAVPTGDGKCVPTKANCVQIELKKGDTEFFDFTAVDGTTTQYEMDIVSVRRTQAATTASAARLHRRKSQAGVAVIASASDSARKSLRRLRYSFRFGVLVAKPKHHR
jgi:hypothetical protein